MSKGTTNLPGLRLIHSLGRLICIVACFQVAVPGSLFAQHLALMSCLSWIHNGAYPSGIEQKRCEANFDLPDPFAIICLGRIAQGQWSDEIEKTACHILLTDLITRQYADYPQETIRLSLGDL